MSKPLALFLDKASLNPDDLKFSLLDDVADWRWFDNVNVSDIEPDMARAEIIVTNKVVLDSVALDPCKKLRLICVAATGVNNVDLAAAKERGVKVCNVRAYATASVAQHVFALVLSLNRKLSSYNNLVRDGGWARSEFFCGFGSPISDLEGKTLGIIGFGELGQAVADIAKGFGMEVIIARRDDEDERDNRVDLAVLLKNADVVSLHCPLTTGNYHMIGADEISMMKPDAIIINTARGGLINESDLLSALQDKAIAGAGLDVLEEEPPDVNHPLVSYRGDNLLLTPHIAWASRESRQRLIEEVAKNIEASCQGQDRNIV